MKTLYVVRHAKSSWDDDSLADFDRTLNERGKTDAPRMGKRLREKNIHPTLLLTSPANRALSTCKKIADQLNYAKDKIKTERDFYHAGSEDILNILKDLKDKHSVVMIFGHNPGLTDFVNDLGEDVNIDNIPTCGVVAFNINIETWKDLSWGKGEFIFFDFPKNLED